MAGCYGDSREDRHFEAMLDRHLDFDYGDDTSCGCDTHYNDNGDLVIDDVLTTRKEIEDNNGWCLECGDKFDIKKWF